jgi:transcriptional regulator with XRE-family HTH domain
MTKNGGPDVGRRLRYLREEQGHSLRSLSEQSGLSINAISQIERGENSPTVASLYRLAEALRVQITELFQPEARQTTVLIRSQQGLVSRKNGVVIESLGIGLAVQQLEPFRVQIEPGAGNIGSPITHRGDEFLHCLQGEIECIVGEQLYQLRAGDSLLFEAEQPHAYHNASGEPASMLLVYQSTTDRNQVMQLHIEHEPNKVGITNHIPF